MRLASLFIVTFSIGVISYPAMNIPSGKAFFADAKGKQAEPAPRPSRDKTDFALLTEYRIIINIPATKLILYENGRPTLSFPIAVGQPIYKTPIGKQEIKELVWNPWWYPPDSEWAKDEKITPPGPKNPLGPVKMPMSADIRLHGTTKDSSIGRAASHGCIRMHSKDAVALAWYLQSHLSGKGDPAFLEKYKKKHSTTFRVSLDRAVPVEIVYDAVAVSGDVITIYPDLYGRVKDIKGMVEWKLFTSGIDPFGLKLSSVAKARLRPIELSVNELLPVSYRSNVNMNKSAGIVTNATSFK